MSALITLIALLGAQPAMDGEMDFPEVRPAVECARHLHDDRARRACLRDLESQADEALSAIAEAAAAEAGEIDRDTGGRFGAAGRFTAAQSAWTAYRDAECSRRSGLLILPEAQQEELAADCRISMSRARADELANY